MRASEFSSRTVTRHGEHDSCERHDDDVVAGSQRNQGGVARRRSELAKRRGGQCVSVNTLPAIVFSHRTIRERIMVRRVHHGISGSTRALAPHCRWDARVRRLQHTKDAVSPGHQAWVGLERERKSAPQ